MNKNTFIKSKNNILFFEKTIDIWGKIIYYISYGRILSVYDFDWG